MYFPSKTNLFRIRLLLISGTILIMLIVFWDIYSNNSDPLGSFGKKRYMAHLDERREQLFKADELLHARLWQLQNLDQQYFALLTVRDDQAAVVKTNASITTAEQAFQKSIDSVGRLGKKYDEEAGTNDFENVTGFFKTILENRRFLAYARLGRASEDRGAASYITVLKLQDELERKDKLLAANTGKNTTEKTNEGIQQAIAERDKQINDLQVQAQKDQVEKQAYTQTIQKLQAEIGEKNNLIAASANKKAPVDQKAVSGLQNEIAQKNGQIVALQAQVRKEQSEKQGLTQSIQKMQAQLAEKDRLITASANKKSPADQKALQGLQSEITQKNQQIASLQAQVRKEQLDRQAYTQTVQKLQTELSEKNKIITASANKKMPVDQKALLSLQNEIVQKNQQIRDLQSVVQKEQSEKKTYSQTVQNLRAELTQKNNLLAAANNKRSPTDQKTLLTLQNTVTEKDRRIRTLEEQLKQSRVVSQPSKPVSTESLKDLQQKNNNLKVAYNSSLTQINLLTRKYNILKSEYDLLRSQR